MRIIVSVYLYPLGEKMNLEKNKTEVRDLILKARQSDQESFNELLRRYMPLIDSLVSKFGADELLCRQIDDVRQEAMLAFYNTVLEYDMEQNEVEFGLYAKMWITFSLRTLREKQKKRQRELLLDTVANDYYVCDSEDPTGKILEEERINALYKIIKAVLSDFEFKVWQLYMSGRSAKEIGATVGKDVRSVNNTIYRARKKLREHCSGILFPNSEA